MLIMRPHTIAETPCSEAAGGERCRDRAMVRVSIVGNRSDDQVQVR